MGFRQRKWTEREKAEARISRYFTIEHQRALQSPSVDAMVKWMKEWNAYCLSGEIPEKLRKAVPAR